ncbi:hypothetical protein CPB86DRAFT_784335, partial [Serendipita vermifera]
MSTRNLNPQENERNSLSDDKTGANNQPEISQTAHQDPLDHPAPTEAQEEAKEPSEDEDESIVDPPLEVKKKGSIRGRPTPNVIKGDGGKGIKGPKGVKTRTEEVAQESSSDTNSDRPIKVGKIRGRATPNTVLLQGKSKFKVSGLWGKPTPNSTKGGGGLPSGP